jgi:hypothetical protein
MGADLFPRSYCMVLRLMDFSLSFEMTWVAVPKVSLVSGNESLLFKSVDCPQDYVLDCLKSNKEWALITVKLG